VNHPSGGRSVKLEDLFNGASSKDVREKNPIKQSDEMVLTPAMLKNTNVKLSNDSVEYKGQQSLSNNSNNTPQLSPPLLSSHLIDSVSSKLLKPDAHKQPVLSMEQLKQTLVHLLQNNADFLHCIHSAYLNGVNRT
jgi:hypothetical protein